MVSAITPNGEVTEVSEVMVTAALSLGWELGGGGSDIGDDPEDEAEPDESENEVEVIDISYFPEPKNCADVAYLLDQAKQNQAMYDALSGGFKAQLGVAVVAKAEQLIGNLAIGKTSSLLELYTAARGVATEIFATLTAAELGAALLFIELVVAIEVFIDDGRWDDLVDELEQKQADMKCKPTGA